MPGRSDREQRRHGRRSRLNRRFKWKSHARKKLNDLNQQTQNKRKAPMKTPTIIAYLKPTCGWSMLRWQN